MDYFYKIPTSTTTYINLLKIETISIELEHLNVDDGCFRVAYLVINGVKYLYDSVHILVRKKMTNEIIEENDKKELEFKRIQTRLKMIVQDIIEKAQLCRQKSNEVEVEKPKMLEKADGYNE